MGQNMAWSRALLLNVKTHSHYMANTNTDSELSLLTSLMKKAKINHKN